MVTINRHFHTTQRTYATLFLLFSIVVLSSLLISGSLVLSESSVKRHLFRKWTQCYGEPASNLIHVLGTNVTLYSSDAYGGGGLAVQLDLRAAMAEDNIVQQSGDVMYLLKFWHEQTGKTITYRGDDYDICCGFLTNSTANACHDKDGRDANCPSGRGEFMASVTRPLFLDKPGNYEVNLVIFRYVQREEGYRERDDLLCVDMPFTIEARKPASNTGVQSRRQEESVREVKTRDGRNLRNKCARKPQQDDDDDGEEEEYRMEVTTINSTDNNDSVY